MEGKEPSFILDLSTLHVAVYSRYSLGHNGGTMSLLMVCG